MDDTLQENTRTLHRRWAYTVYDWVSTLVIALLVLVTMLAFVFRTVRVDGASMEGTLKDNDQLLLLTSVEAYERGDIVVIDRYTIEPIVKRIIAIAGDTIQIDNSGDVYLNDARLSEPYAVGKTYARDMSGPVKVPAGYVFIMGDNRAISLDSRSTEIGLVSIKDIIGKAVFRLTPYSSFGGIYDNMEQNVG